MDLDILLRSQPALIFLGTLVLGWMGWGFRQHISQLMQKAIEQTAGKAALEALSGRVNKHGERIMIVETALQHLPTAQQVNALTVAISDLRGELRAVGENVENLERQMGGIGRRLDLIDAHLRENRQ